MTTNPTRPASGQVVATTWGLSVADTVVRRYANAASRDADLTGHTSADMLGQVCTLTDSGSTLQYVGPVMGWRPPWNMPWGYVMASESNGSIVGDGTLQTILTTPSFTQVAGRRYRFSGGCTMVSGAVSCRMFAYAGASQIGSWRINHPTPEGSCYTGERFVSIGTTSTLTASLRFQGTSPGQLATNGDPSHWLAIEDVGPASTPTALVADADGTETVTAEELDRLAAMGAVLLADGVRHE